jgi:hypothetical protein
MARNLAFCLKYRVHFIEDSSVSTWLSLTSSLEAVSVHFAEADNKASSAISVIWHNAQYGFVEPSLAPK